MARPDAHISRRSIDEERRAAQDEALSHLANRLLDKHMPLKLRSMKDIVKELKEELEDKIAKIRTEEGWGSGSRSSIAYRVSA